MSARVSNGCSFDGCERPGHSRGLCNGHFQQQWHGRELTPLKPHVVCLPYQVIDRGPHRAGLLVERETQREAAAARREIEDQAQARVSAVPSAPAGPIANGLLYAAVIAVLKLRPELLVRLFAKISPCPITGCWWWTGTTTEAGYARRAIAGRYVFVHRLLFALLHGVPPDDLECDHLCRQRSCVNPGHLELVTRLVNVQRSASFYLSAGDAAIRGNTLWKAENSARGEA